MSERKTPESLQAEQSLIGAMLIEPTAIITASGITSAEQLYRQTHQFLFQVIVSMHKLGEPVDLVTVCMAAAEENRMQDFGGVAYLTALIKACPSATNVESYAKAVRDNYLRREAIRAAEQIINDAYDTERGAGEILVNAERRILEISKVHVSAEAATSKELIEDQRKRVLYAYENPGAEIGVSTGFLQLDEMTNGLHAGQLIVVAGRPAMGKSAFASDVVLGVLKSKRQPVIVFSAEMPQQQWIDRMVCAEARVGKRELLRGIMSEDEWGRVAKAQDLIAGLPLYVIDKPGITIEEMRAICQKLAALHGQPALVAIDYLQITETATREKDERMRITVIARAFKNLARLMKCPVVALSQLSRAVEQRNPPRPMLADLKESSAIEAEADIVIFPYRPLYYAMMAAEQSGTQVPTENLIDELILGKQRDGAVGNIPVRFVPEYATFENYTQEN